MQFSIVFPKGFHEQSTIFRMPSIRRNLHQIGHRAACPICAFATYSIEFCEFQLVSWTLLSAWNTNFLYLHRICHGLSDAIFIRFPIRISLTIRGRPFRKNLRQIWHWAACPICAFATYSIEFYEFQWLSWIVCVCLAPAFFRYLHKICRWAVRCNFQ